MISREIVTDVTAGVIVDQFYAERLYSRGELTAVLARAGFADVTVHAEVATSSARNQDLGMMAHRLFVTASAREVDRAREAEGARVAPRARDVVVVLGDPRQPDAVKPGGAFGPDDHDAIARMQRAFADVAALGDRDVRYLSDHRTLLADLQRLDGAPLIVNFCDEGLGNHARRELHVPALLDALGLAYTGAGPACLARCVDKGLVRGVARELGIAVAAGVVLGPDDPVPAFVRPVIVKPNDGDGSFGIDERCVAHDGDQLARAIAAVRAVIGVRGLVLVEELLTGPELGVGIVGNPPGAHRVLPIIEEDYSALPAGLPRICSYRAKWDPSSPYWQLRSVRAELPAATRDAIISASRRLFARLECRDYARIDWRLDAAGVPHLLEVNPNPGWCWDGHLAKMAALDHTAPPYGGAAGRELVPTGGGISYPQLLAAILDAAGARLAAFPSRVVDHPTGRALVADRDVAAGTIVAHFDGPLFTTAELPPDEIRHALWIGPASWMVPITPARFANHSCEPTCDVVVGDDDEIRIVTRRAVAAGGELTFDYGAVASLDPASADSAWDPRWSFRCACGAQGCRGMIDRYVVTGETAP